MEYAYEGPAVVTSVPHPGAPTERRTLPIRLLPAHPDSPGAYGLILPNQTGCVLSARGAKALLDGRTIWIRIERVYQVVLQQFVVPKPARAVPGPFPKEVP